MKSQNTMLYCPQQTSQSLKLACLFICITLSLVSFLTLLTTALTSTSVGKIPTGPSHSLWEPPRLQQCWAPLRQVILHWTKANKLNKTDCFFQEETEQEFWPFWNLASSYGSLSLFTKKPLGHSSTDKCNRQHHSTGPKLSIWSKEEVVDTQRQLKHTYETKG